MKINWIIEKHLFTEYEHKLVDTIINSGHNCDHLDDTDIFFDFDKRIKNKYSEKDCVIFYGSLNRGRQVWRDTNFIPGIFLTIDKYECYKYYGYFGDEMVNSNYLLFGINDIKRNKKKIFDFFNSDEIFIRPSNGYKTFTGQLLSIDNFNNEFDTLCKSYGGLDMHQLVLVAPKQEIKEENRFIVINENGVNRIIDGNTYISNGELLKDRMTDIDALKYAETIVNNYTPDKVFTIDIAKMSDGEYKILEIGSFCCASLYNADLEITVNEINKLCLNEYNDYYNIKN